jgi:FRG domain
MKKTFDSTINTVQEYLDIIHKIKVAQEANGNKADLIFRGQSEDKPLLPKLARLSNEGLLNGSIHTVENLMMAEFQRNILPLSEFKPDNDWDLLALAQHYGLPTRLLDWSYSALVALWFAVKSAPKADGVVWILATLSTDFREIKKDKSPYKVKSSKIFRSAVVSRRISSQVGLFTLHLIEDDGKVYQFETTRDFKTRLTKIGIPSKSFAILRKQLDILGVNNATIFPDMIGLCDHLQWRFSKYSDEIELKK